MIRITLDGAPVGKGRARFTSAGGFGRAYTPAKTRAYEAALSTVARKVMDGAEPISGPISLFVQARVAIPASWSKAKKQSARTGLIMPTSKPDWDNYGKITDALNGIVWIDDSQIVRGSVVKFYADDPALVVEVQAI